MSEQYPDPGTSPDPVTPDLPDPFQNPDTAQPEIVPPNPDQPTIDTDPDHVDGEKSPETEVPD